MTQSHAATDFEPSASTKSWMALKERIQARKDLSEEIKGWLYAYSSGGLDVGGARLAFVDCQWGRADGDGPVPCAEHDSPILCLHGNPTWSFLYRNVARAFGMTNRIVIPDHVGCGFSDKPQAYPYTLEKHIDNVEKLVDHLGLKKIILCVHDWGGAIGFGLAARRPEIIERMVVFNTAAFPSPRMPLSIALCRVPGIGALAVRGFNAFLRGAFVRCTVKPLSRDAKQGFLFPYGSWHDRVALHRFVLDIPMDESHPSWRTLKGIEEALPKLATKPMLICWGAKDFVFNDSFLEKWKQHFPQAEVHRYQNAGHWLLEDVGEEVIEAMRTFLGVTP